MEKLHREPDATRQDYYAFVNELKLFHQNRGTPFRQVPKINGREIDLQKLYNQVTALGGLQKVIDHDKWDTVVEVLKLPKACANFSLGLRQIYIRFLGHYEKIHFMGEEPHYDKNQSSESHHRKMQLTLFHQVPMVYNFLQHDITAIARSTSGLNQNFVTPTDYDKLCMSLLSGLPNEQEMALNVCTILSNEGNYMLHLEQCPRLVKLLIAQAGIFPSDDASLKMLYLQSWNGLKGRNMYRFWRSTLDLQNPLVVQLLDFDLGDYDPDETLLNLESDVGALNVEGQRVLRVALILHNLSFEKNNVPVLVANTNFIRFLLLSIYSSWTNIKQTAYDTLSNIASEIKLTIEKDVFSRLIFQTVMKGILSYDRYMNIRSMDILSQLCSCEPNEDIIPSRLDVEVYQNMVSFLSVHDIMLLFFTLEALYALSDLGRYACEKIVCVHRAIGVLVSLLTLDPSQYGPSGQIKMKVVETLVPAEFEEQEEKQGVTSEPPVVPTSNDLDSDTFAGNWLKSSLEASSGSLIARNELYAEFVSHCTKSGRKGVINANIFAGYVKNTFPHCGIKRLESGNGMFTFYHEGLKRKEVVTSQTGSPNSKLAVITSTPCKVPLPTTPVSCKPGQKLTHSPILKAQLSAPPRSGATSPPLKRLAEHAANSQKSTSFQPIRSTPQAVTLNSVANQTPGSSTLIKSLLANKVQQRNLQRQVIPQGFSKMVIYSSDKVRNQVVRAPTLLRCGRPAAFGSPLRTPFQARIIANKGRLITSAPPKLKNPLLAPISPRSPKFIKHCPRLNGVQRDMHMEVCHHDEESKSNKDMTILKVDSTNCFQNHVSNDSLDSRSSISCDGDSLQSFKDMDVDSDCSKNSVSQEKAFSYKFSGTNENAVSPGNILFVKPKPSTEVLHSPKEQNGTSVNFVNSNDTVTDVAVVAPSQPKIVSTSNSILNVLNNLDSQLDDLSEQLQKDKICKKAPLLNGLLDKGKLQLSKEITSNSLSLLQNGNKDFSMEINDDGAKSVILPVQSALNANPVSMNSVIPPIQNAVTQISLLNSPAPCFVTLQSSVLTSSNSIILQPSTSNTTVTACLFNCVSVPSSNPNLVSSPLLNSVITSSTPNAIPVTSLNSIIPTLNSTSICSQPNSNTLQSFLIPLSSQIVKPSSKSIEHSSNSTGHNSSISVINPSPNASVELSSNSCVEPSSNSTKQVSLNSPTMSSSSIVLPTSISTVSQSSITTTFSSPVTYLTNSISSVSSIPSVINSTLLSSTAFHSEGDNLMQICTGQATLSGTIEVQPDQKGVVRLHIESPENSNQGSDLSSISDIARTLECASKAISRTNAECNTQVPHCGTCETTATVTVITTNTPTLARAGQQIIVVTPALNQPQLHIQSPNIKFRILHSLPKTEESSDLVGFSHVNLNQLNQFRQPTPETPSISNATLKRPSSNNTSICTPDLKKPRIDTKTPLLEATLSLATPVPCSVATSSVNTKTSTQGTHSLLTKVSLENIGSSPKLTTAKAVLVQNTDIPNEKEAKTFSGLSSICDNPSLSTSPQVPPKPLSSKLEFLCEWKDCGLKFPNPGSVFLHASKVHVPMCNDDMVCLWESCDSMKRRRFSLLTHLQDWHCNEKVLHIQALRRKQLSQQGKTTISPPQMPPPHPGYAPDAAFLAIRRHALQYINPKELSEEKESALTKSIRLTSALILRNLVTHSSLARTYVRRFEPELAYLAMSPVESARTIAQCLTQLSRPHD